MEFKAWVARVDVGPSSGRPRNALGSRDTSGRGTRSWEPELADSFTPEARREKWVRALGRGCY